jgi:Flp pilus assembly protein TadG
MMRTHQYSERGSVLIEFTLVGIAAITLLMTTIQICLGLWNYHTLAYAVHEATRYVSAHGRGCVTAATPCTITVGNIVTKLASDTLGMPANSLNVTLTTDSGATTTCNPSTVCSANTTQWPPTSNLDNVTGKSVTITASYTFATDSMLIIWPGSFIQRFSAFVLPASSTETILF